MQKKKRDDGTEDAQLIISMKLKTENFEYAFKTKSANRQKPTAIFYMN